MNKINHSTLGQIPLFSAFSINDKLSLQQKNSPTNKKNVVKKQTNTQPTTGKVSFDAKAELSKIEAAATVESVSKLISALNVKMKLMKKANASAELMLSVKTVIKKALRKLTELKEEEKAAQKAKEAERKKEYEESQKLNNDLLHRRLNRKMREIDDVKNADGEITSGTDPADALSFDNIDISSAETDIVAVATEVLSSAGVDVTT